MNKFILLLILSLVSCDDNDQIIYRHFKSFVKKYDKKYSSMEEYLARFKVFRENYLTNLKNGQQKYDVGITKFSDMTPDEFAKTFLNFKPNANAFHNIEAVRLKQTNDLAPDAFDWRDKGVVTDVKNQSGCGSCWSFGTTGNLEGLYALKKGVIKTFSEQFLIDCDTQDNGCEGGYMINAFDWIKENGGFMSEEDYPFTGQKGTCKQDPSKFVDMKVVGYVKLGFPLGNLLFPCDENEMKEFLYQTGPLAVAINAAPLQYYTGGIIDDDNCSNADINHAVTLVGYGTDSKDYWIVKNSWGKNWGENGYFRIARGKATCGINYYVISATVEF